MIEVNCAGALQEARGLVNLHRIDIKLFSAKDKERIEKQAPKGDR